MDLSQEFKSPGQVINKVFQKIAILLLLTIITLLFKLLFRPHFSAGNEYGSFVFLAFTFDRVSYGWCQLQ